MSGHTGPIVSVCFSPDGRMIVTGSWDNLAMIWDAKTGSKIGDPLKGHFSSIICVNFSKDGNMIVTGSNDETIKIW